jgi:hypothetical protein
MNTLLKALVATMSDKQLAESIRSLPDSDLVQLVRLHLGDQPAASPERSAPKQAAAKPKRTPRSKPKPKSELPPPRGGTPAQVIREEIYDKVKASGDGGIQSPQLASVLGRSKTAVMYHLRGLRDDGRVRCDGSRRAARWVTT